MGVEQVAAQRVQGFALVELAGDLAAVVRVGQVAGGVDGATQRSALFERRSEGVLSAGHGQLADQQGGGGVSELQRPRQPEQVVVVLGDPLQVQLACQQRSRVWEPGLHLRARPRPVQGAPAEIPDPRRQLESEQIEQAEVRQGDYVDKSSVPFLLGLGLRDRLQQRDVDRLHLLVRRQASWTSVSS